VALANTVPAALAPLISAGCVLIADLGCVVCAVGRIQVAGSAEIICTCAAVAARCAHYTIDCGIAERADELPCAVRNVIDDDFQRRSLQRILEAIDKVFAE
jgi:hypothetical protein